MKKTLSFTIIFILVFSSFSFATEFPSVPDDNNQYYVISTYGNITSLFTSSKPIQAHTAYNNTLRFQDFIEYKNNNGIWTKVLQKSNPINSTFNEILKSSHDIYYENSSDVFFSLPTVKIWEEGMTEALPRLLGQILKLLPIILGLVISGLALRKGWKMLKTVLSGA